MQEAYVQCPIEGGPSYYTNRSRSPYDQVVYLLREPTARRGPVLQTVQLRIPDGSEVWNSY